MESTLKKLVLAATLGLALALTFSCSSSDDNGGGGGGGSGGDVLYSSSYYDDDDYDDYSSSSSVIKSISSSSVEVGCPNAVIGDNTVSCGGQTYRTVKIENQTWMAENLNYDVVGSVCYDNDPANCDKYGRLYKWATAMALPDSCNGIKCTSIIGTKHKGICPSGWHIPSDDDWATLANFVGASTAGTKLKATSGWNNYNGKSGNGQDTYGFAALPGGFGNSDGSFANAGGHGLWWSASEDNSDSAYYRVMSYSYEGVYYFNYDKDLLFSVRCVQD